MGKPTFKDNVNAAFYATRMLARYRLELAKESDPLLKDIEIFDANWPRRGGFYLPAGLVGSNVASRFVNESECSALSCFGFTKDYAPCTKWHGGGNFSIDGREYAKCQDACFRLTGGEKVRGFETLWRDGKCLLANTAFKVWCLFPNSRVSSRYKHVAMVTDVPGFAWDDLAQTCSVTKEYCEAFEVTFDGTQCVVPPGVQSVGEFVFGRTVTRGSRRFFEKMLPEAIDRTRTRRDAGEKKGPTAVNPITLFEEIWDAQKGQTHDVDAMELFVARMARDFGMQYAYDAAARVVGRVGRRLAERLSAATLNPVWRALVKTGNSAMVRAMARAVVIRVMVRAIGGAAMKTAIAAATSASNSAMWAVTCFSIIGLILDAVDPYGYNKMLDPPTIEMISDGMWNDYDKTFWMLLEKADSSSEYEVTPEYYMKFADEVKNEATGNEDADEEDDNEVYNAVYYSHVHEYLKHLTVNSLGQVIDWSDDDDEKEGGLDVAEAMSADFRNLVARLTELRVDNLRRRYANSGIGNEPVKIASALLACGLTLLICASVAWLYPMVAFMVVLAAVAFASIKESAGPGNDIQ